MQYDELSFRAERIQQDRERRHREELIAASFNAYQLLRAQVEKLPPWDKYLKSLGLVESKKVSEEQVAHEIDVAKRNAERIAERVKQYGSRQRTF